MLVDKVSDYRTQFSKWWISEYKNVQYPEKVLAYTLSAVSHLLALFTFLTEFVQHTHYHACSCLCPKVNTCDSTTWPWLCYNKLASSAM